MITLTIEDVNKKVEESKHYPTQQSQIPFTGYALSNGLKAIQNF